jgi:hypothetical protein
MQDLFAEYALQLNVQEHGLMKGVFFKLCYIKGKTLYWTDKSTGQQGNNLHEFYNSFHDKTYTADFYFGHILGEGQAKWTT